MIRWRGKLSPEVRALLDEERAIPAQPAAVRARAMARARAALAAGVAAPVASPSHAVSRSRWAAAAVLVGMAGAAAVVAAYGIHLHVARVAPPVVTPLVAPPVTVAAAWRAADAPPVVAPADDEAPAPPRTPSPPRLSRAEALRAELRLLRRARAAVAREDFAAALVPIAEHVRRFKDGRLAEEREALRVKALVGLGRTEDARRAAVTFRTRFPHSVLLSAVDRMSASGP